MIQLSQNRPDNDVLIELTISVNHSDINDIIADSWVTEEEFASTLVLKTGSVNAYFPYSNGRNSAENAQSPWKNC